ncbi:MAG: hypothetical protein MUF06_08315 [Pirellulaceae bacterium]|jgi:hypothetical protein|nr:hypothetical protein [Pirellulaceae bacterium]
MRFDPRLIHPDEPPERADGELDLPDHLAALAEQLADDAAHLSLKYPAEPPAQLSLAARLAREAEAVKRAGHARRARLLAWLSVATVAAVAVSTSIVLLSAGNPAQSPRQLSQAVDAALSEATVPGQAVASRTARVPHPPRPLGGVPGEPGPMLREVSAGPGSAALSLGDLSGPEMEALFDLLHRESPDVASVSF